MRLLAFVAVHLISSFANANKENRAIQEHLHPGRPCGVRRRWEKAAMNAAAFAMRAGAFAEELLLGDPPRAALASGFRFTYPGADEALAAILGRVWEKRDRRNNGPEVLSASAVFLKLSWRRSPCPQEAGSRAASVSIGAVPRVLGAAGLAGALAWITRRFNRRKGCGPSRGNLFWAIGGADTRKVFRTLTCALMYPVARFARVAFGRLLLPAVEALQRSERKRRECVPSNRRGALVKGLANCPRLMIA